MSLVLAATLTGALLTAQNIEKPVFQTIDIGSPQATCIADQVRAQGQKIIGAGDINVMGPMVKRDYKPQGSTYELLVSAPNGAPYPRFLVLSVVLETPDRSLWTTRDLGNGKTEFRASAMLNPAYVFDRTQIKFLFELDLSSCIKSEGLDGRGELDNL